MAQLDQARSGELIDNRALDVHRDGRQILGSGEVNHGGLLTGDGDRHDRVTVAQVDQRGEDRRAGLR